ncbi:MAG: response regulator transcription factor [Anaerolineae bacterium]|nr:response regulator transcription factor [Anaerolineae bacterium]
MSATILIIEDDVDLLQLLRIDLQQSGYKALVAHNGALGLKIFQEKSPDLVMIDVALPDADGLEICQQIRTISNVPILIMTGHAVSEAQIAQGLNLGADEYMVKPLGKLELHARIKALLRRAGFDMQGKQPLVYEDDYLSVNLGTRRVQIEGQEIRLTPTEYKLLATFIMHSDEVLTFEQILETVWGEAYRTEHHYPRIYVSHLRRKIEPNPQLPVYIVSEYGVGYRFRERRKV